MVIICGAIYFAIDGAFDSWTYCRDQLGLQKVLTETMDKVMNGTVKEYGVKDSLEIVSAGKTSLEFIPPWVDDTHASAGREFIYTLNGAMKSGSATPIGEIRMPETNRWRLVPVLIAPTDDSDTTRVKLGLSVPESSDLRFVYHADYVKEPDAVSKIHWDPKTGDVLYEHGERTENFSKNFFGVEILGFKMSYYTNHNDPVEDGDWVNESDLDTVTGIQVEMEARLGEQTQKLIRFVNLRNSPLRTGYLTLKKDMKVRIPDSKHIKALLITNLSGVADNDVLTLEVVPQAGKAWRVKFEFEKVGSQKAVVKMMTVEYPPQKPVFTEYPRTPVDIGINLLILGSDGRYDYDDDEDVDDAVVLEGNVDLYVTEMSVKGAGLFVRP